MRQTKAIILDRAAAHLLGRLANEVSGHDRRTAQRSAEGDTLIASDLATWTNDGRLQITDAGRAYLARHAAHEAAPAIDPFRAQHGHLARETISDAGVRSSVLIDEAESPLIWLARRKGRDGRPLIEAHQFLAGERLRADFTRAQMMPRTTSNWEAPVARHQRSGGSPVGFADATLVCRERVQNVLAAVGPEFSGLLLDVCCFLKRLEDIERERLWPSRSAKVVLQLALDRLARHYGLAAQARGAPHPSIRMWSAPDTDAVANG